QTRGAAHAPLTVKRTPSQRLDLSPALFLLEALRFLRAARLGLAPHLRFDFCPHDHLAQTLHDRGAVRFLPALGLAAQMDFPARGESPAGGVFETLARRRTQTNQLVRHDP